MNQSKLFTLSLMLMTVMWGYCQKSPSKFGKISNQEISATVCPIDSSAHAYFIFDFGRTYFQYASTTVRESDVAGEHKGFQMFFERHYRIKILNDNAFDWADIAIPLYHSAGDKEQITQFKAATYNKSGKKIESVKLRAKDLISIEKNENWDIMKCAMPQVKAGSVIEVSYTVKSDFLYNLQSWAFQHTIPILHTEYHLSVPEYFHYNQTQRGYFHVDLAKETKRSTIEISYHTTHFDRSGSGHSKSKQSFDYDEILFHYTASSIPAFPVEAYLTTAQNYISKVDFELAWTKLPKQTMDYYTKSWDDINKNLLNKVNFGMQLKRSRFLQDESEQIKSQYSDTLAQIQAAFAFVKKKFIWNGRSNKFASSTLRDAYKSKAGNSADINLTLVVLLRELGFESYPVILSTRTNGMIHPSHPSMSSFNYVIAMATDGQNTYLMDATEPLSGINFLPIRCLNNKGWIVDEKKSGWINLQNGDFSKSATYNLALDQEGNFTGDLHYTYNNYSAYQERLAAARETDAESYLQQKFDNIDGLVIKNSELIGIDSLYAKVETRLDVEISGKLENAGALYFFEPMFMDAWEKNPFKIENREYPVEFEYPMTDMQSVTIAIPDGFVVEELPQPAIIQLDDGSAKFMYSINQLGNKIQITSIFSINKIRFLPEQYPFLKQLFDLLVAKHQEQIVLKKV